MARAAARGRHLLLFMDVPHIPTSFTSTPPIPSQHVSGHVVHFDPNSTAFDQADSEDTSFLDTNADTATLWRPLASDNGGTLRRIYNLGERCIKFAPKCRVSSTPTLR